MKKIRAAVEARGIKYVIHFTRLANLPQILEEGLIPRSELEKSAQQPNFNDEHRFDLQKDAICCSLGFPNYKMFYSLRQQHEEKWIICIMKSCILWEKDCAFCIENAASNRVTCIPLKDRKGHIAFNAMFDDYDGKPPRADLKLPDACPTNPQAEVLVLGRVEPEYILGAGCQSKDTTAHLSGLYNGYSFLDTPFLFSARKDYAHWK